MIAQPKLPVMAPVALLRGLGSKRAQENSQCCFLDKLSTVLNTYNIWDCTGVVQLCRRNLHVARGGKAALFNELALGWLLQPTRGTWRQRKICTWLVVTYTRRVRELGQKHYHRKEKGVFFTAQVVAIRRPICDKCV